MHRPAVSQIITTPRPSIAPTQSFLQELQEKMKQACLGNEYFEKKLLQDYRDPTIPSNQKSTILRSIFNIFEKTPGLIDTIPSSLLHLLGQSRSDSVVDSINKELFRRRFGGLNLDDSLLADLKENFVDKERYVDQDEVRGYFEANPLIKLNANERGLPIFLDISKLSDPRHQRIVDAIKSVEKSPIAALVKVGEGEKNEHWVAVLFNRRQDGKIDCTICNSIGYSNNRETEHAREIREKITSVLGTSVVFNRVERYVQHDTPGACALWAAGLLECLDKNTDKAPKQIAESYFNQWYNARPEQRKAFVQAFRSQLVSSMEHLNKQREQTAQEIQTPSIAQSRDNNGNSPARIISAPVQAMSITPASKPPLHRTPVTAPPLQIQGKIMGPSMCF